MQTTTDMRAVFRRDGIVSIPNFSDETMLQHVARDISGVFVRRADALGIAVPRGSSHDDLSAQLKGLFAVSPTEYINAAKFAQHLVIIHRIGVGDAMVNVLKSLGIDAPAVSTRPVIHFMANDLRIEGGYHKTPVHQDWRSVQGSVDGLTVWMPLFDVTPNDYPLEIIPGSHRRGLLPSGDHAFGHQLRDGIVNDSEFVSVPLKAGTAAFFSGFLVHRTGVAGGERVRIALSYRFNNAADPSFIRRGYPDRYVYRAEMELLDPEFPPAALIDETFAID